MSGFQISAELDPEQLIGRARASERLRWLGALVFELELGPATRDGADLVAVGDAHDAELGDAADAGAEEGRAQVATTGGLDVEGGRVALAVVDGVARVPEEREHLLDLADGVVLGRLDPHGVRVAAEARHSVGLPDAGHDLVLVHERQVELAVALEAAALATVRVWAGGLPVSSRASGESKRGRATHFRWP